MLTFMGSMKRVVNAFVRERNKRMSRYDLTSAQVDVLIVLLRAPEGVEIFQSTIQKKLALSCPTVNGLLRRLEEKGFIRFEKNVDDLRCKRIVLTAKGWEVDSILAPLGGEWEQRLTQNFSAAELLVLGELMAKLESNSSLMDAEMDEEVRS